MFPVQLWSVSYFRQSSANLLPDPEISQHKVKECDRSRWTLLMQSASRCDRELQCQMTPHQCTDFCLQGALYVTVSIIALCIGCEETKEPQIAGLLLLAHVGDWNTMFAASPQNCNFMLITTSRLKRKASRRIHCVSLHMKLWFPLYVYGLENQRWACCSPSKPRICHWASV